LYNLRDSSMAGRHDGEPACHRLEHRVGNALGISACCFAWMKENVDSKRDPAAHLRRIRRTGPIADSENPAVLLSSSNPS
jgi:hypothetical protein